MFCISKTTTIPCHMLGRKPTVEPPLNHGVPEGGISPSQNCRSIFRPASPLPLLTSSVQEMILLPASQRNVKPRQGTGLQPPLPSLFPFFLLVLLGEMGFIYMHAYISTNSGSAPDLGLIFSSKLSFLICKKIMRTPSALGRPEKRRRLLGCMAVFFRNTM